MRKELAFLLFAAAALLAGCSLTSTVVSTGKYFPENKTEFRLISKSEFSRSFVWNLHTLFPEDAPAMEAWINCRGAKAMEEIVYRRGLIQKRYSRPDAWMGAGTPSYISVAEDEIRGYEEKAYFVRQLMKYTAIPERPCTSESKVLAYAFARNYEDGKYNWSKYNSGGKDKK